MKRATFDLLDASIPEAYDFWQGLPDASRFTSYFLQFQTDPTYWNAYVPVGWETTLTWQEYRYKDLPDRASIDAQITATDPGIYIFYIRPEAIVHRFPSYPLYVGISNEKGTGRPLRERLKECLPSNISTIRKRENIDQMLQLFYGVLYVAYALTPAKSNTELRQFEERLHGYLYPRFSRRDFPKRIKSQQKRAWQ